MVAEKPSQAPWVLFFDYQGWNSFDQVAAALRRRGLRTARLALRPPAGLVQSLRAGDLRWVADRLFYDEVLVLSRPERVRRLDELLASDAVADVIVTEDSLLAVGADSEVGRRLTARALAFAVTPPEVLLDKFAVNERLAAAGVGTPVQLAAHEISPRSAAERLGMPLMLKPRVGAGGQGVRLIESLPGLEAALNELGGAGEDMFLQQHAPGPVVVYGAVRDAGGTLMEHGFRVEQPLYPLGPAATASLYDHPDLLRAGRRAADLFGSQGFTSFGFIETPDGRFLHIDANSRIWGMIFAAAGLGIDFTAVYAAHIKGRASPSKPLPPARSAPLPIFPSAVLEAVDRRAFGAAATVYLELVKTCGPALGPSYCGYVAARALRLAVRRLRQASPRPAPTPSNARASPLAAVESAAPPPAA